MSGNGGGHGHEEHIVEQYKKRHQTAQDLGTKLETVHMEAYLHATKEVLENKDDPRKVELERLKDAKEQQKFVDEMSKTYIKKAKEFLQAKDPEWKTDEWSDRLLMYAVTGATKEDLYEMIVNEKENLTPGVFMKYKDEYLKGIKSKLLAGAGAEIKTEKHIEQILEHVMEEDVAKELKEYGISIIDAARYFAREYEGEKFKASDVITAHKTLAQQSGGKAVLLSQPIITKLEKMKKKKKGGHDEEEEEAHAGAEVHQLEHGHRRAA